MSTVATPKTPKKTPKPRAAALGRAEIVAELVTQLSLSKAKAHDFVDALIATIQKKVSQGHRVELRGFATFALKRTAARRMRNPATRNPANIAKRKAAKQPPAPEFINVPARESAVAKASPRFLSGKRSGAV